MNIWKSTIVYTAFVFMGHSFWKENIEERVKLLESKVFNCCLKITMANLWKIGVKMREGHFRELGSWISKRGRAMSHFPSARKVHLWCIFFALPAMNGPFPADLNFRENTVFAGILSEQYKKEHKTYSLSLNSNLNVSRRLQSNQVKRSRH